MMQIQPQDFSITTYNTSEYTGGFGNKNEKGVTVRHIPTGIERSYGKGRSQHKNRFFAMEALMEALKEKIKETLQVDIDNGVSPVYNDDSINKPKVKMLKPLKNLIIIERLTDEMATSSGIVIQSASTLQKATVISVGEFVSVIKPGDVIVPNWSAVRNLGDALIVADQDVYAIEVKQ